MTKSATIRHDDTRRTVERAKALYDLGEIEAALSLLRNHLSGQYHAGHDMAYELTIEWLMQLKNHQEARRIASYFLSHHPNSESAKKIIDLFDGLERLKAEQGIDDEEQPEDKTIDPSQRLLDLESNLDTNAIANHVLREAPITLAERIIAEKNGPSLGFAYARLAFHHFHLGDLVTSMAFAKSAKRFLPSSHASLIRRLIEDIDKIDAVDINAIGILLPLSGPLATYGHKVLEVMAWALGIEAVDTGQGITEIKAADLKIIVADTRGSPANTGALIDSLVKEHRVAIAIGDIVNESSLSAAVRCAQYSLPLLSLAHHPWLPGMNKNVFIMTASPMTQIESLVNHAMRVSGHQRFAILYPRHNYGMAMSRLFFDEVIRNNGSITGIEAYDPHETNFFDPVKKLIGKYYLDARPEYLACSKRFLDSTPHGKAMVKQRCGRAMVPVVDFDALFIPEFQKLAYIIPTLVQEDILITDSAYAAKAFLATTKSAQRRAVQILGSGSWNDTNTLVKIISHVDGAYFVDAIDFDANDALREFKRSIIDKHGIHPTALQAFAFDAARLAKAVLHSPKLRDEKPVKRSAIRDLLADFNDSVGLLANISFNAKQELAIDNVGFLIKDGQVRAAESS